MLDKGEFVKDVVKLVRIDCPAEIFDTEGAYIMRRKRIAIWKLDSIRAFKPGQEDDMARLYADLVPQWHGIVDPDTGQPLDNLADDPKALFQLDNEQVGWLTQMLQVMPGKLPKSMNGQTP